MGSVSDVGLVCCMVLKNYLLADRHQHLWYTTRRGKESKMRERESCPQCGSRWYTRNGHIHTGKQNHRCQLCGRAFVLVPEHHVTTDEQRAVIERLLLERISRGGICRA